MVGCGCCCSPDDSHSSSIIRTSQSKLADKQLVTADVFTFTSFSEFPRHLEATDEAEILKNVVLHSVATALASKVLPVPGGPYSKMPYSACTNGSHLERQDSHFLAAKDPEESACLTKWKILQTLLCLAQKVMNAK